VADWRVSLTETDGRKLHVACWAETATAEARDYFEERAAIREYNGGQSRVEAEAEAAREAMQAEREGRA
jgi:hypothetical protein